MSGLFILSGCSGGGKTTLLEELSRRGFHTVPEPGLRIVREELAGSGRALPWVDPEAFAHRALTMSRADLAGALAHGERPVFFDRGLVDAAAALEHALGRIAPGSYDGAEAFERRVFLVPPWRANFRSSDEREHSYADACAEYERLVAVYDRLGFAARILPPESVEARADCVIAAL